VCVAYFACIGLQGQSTFVHQNIYPNMNIFKTIFNAKQNMFLMMMMMMMATKEKNIRLFFMVLREKKN
jgi:GH15 family glucan-1,4-alpha-glucosidase